MTTTKEKTTTESVGDTGAKRSSQMPVNPRGILRQIMDETPSFERAKDREQVIYGKMKAKLNEGDKINLDRYPLLLAMFEYWFTNEYRNLTPRTRRDQSDLQPSDEEDIVPSDEMETAAPQKEETIKEKAEYVAEAKEALKAAIKKIMHLDTIMPNGLPFGDCTGADFAGWSGDFAKFAAKMKPTDKAREVFSDDDLKAIQQ